MERRYLHREVFFTNGSIFCNCGEEVDPDLTSARPCTFDTSEFVVYRHEGCLLMIELDDVFTCKLVVKKDGKSYIGRLKDEDKQEVLERMMNNTVWNSSWGACHPALYSLDEPTASFIAHYWSELRLEGEEARV